MAKSDLHPTLTPALPAGFTQRLLTESDAPSLSALLLRQTADYLRFFNAFSFDEASLARRLASVRQDIYGGFFRGNELIGIYLVRGWDEGYAIPSLGGFIDEKYRGVMAYKLMALTVEIGKDFCRQRGARRIMYKAHPKNTPARSARRLGFIPAGIDERSGFQIFHLDLDSPS